MTTTHRRVLGAGIAATAIAALVAGTPALAGPGNKPAVKGNPNLTSVQLLSFNDYHGHLQATDGPLSAGPRPLATPVGWRRVPVDEAHRAARQGRRRAGA